VPDSSESVFKFGPPRPVEFSFRLPPWLRQPTEVFRMDADGVHEVKWAIAGERLTIQDSRSQDAVYIAAINDSVRTGILQRRQKALDQEAASPVDMDALRAIGK